MTSSELIIAGLLDHVYRVTRRGLTLDPRIVAYDTQCRLWTSWLRTYKDNVPPYSDAGMPREHRIATYL